MLLPGFARSAQRSSQEHALQPSHIVLSQIEKSPFFPKSVVRELMNTLCLAILVCVHVVMSQASSHGVRQTGDNLIPDLGRHAHVTHLVCLQASIAFGRFGRASRWWLHLFMCSCASRMTLGCLVEGCVLSHSNLVCIYLS